MESWHEKLALFHKIFLFVISKMWLDHRIAFIFFIAAIWLFLLSLWFLIISPIIFNFFIVPNIERKLNQKIGHQLIDEYIWLGKWMNTQTWTSLYIANRYYAWKIKKDRGLPTAKYFNHFPLKVAGYTIDQVSKTEIFFSFILIIVMILGFFITIFFGVPLMIFKSYILTH